MTGIINLSVTDIVFETADCITIRLKVIDGSSIKYLPGQFLTLIFTVRGKEIRRSFSLSSTPEIDKDLAITVKIIPNGEISTYLFHRLRIGDTIQSLLPAGRFVLEIKPEKQRDIFMVAAGSGITPIYSILKNVLNTETKSRITLIYSNRNEKSTIFYAPLKGLETKYPDQFKCIFIFSDPEAKDYPYKAHLNLELLRDLITNNLTYDRNEAEFMLCGPFVYMRMAEMIIIAMGFDERRIHKENFVVLSKQEALNSIPDQTKTDKTAHISYNGAKYDILVAAGKPVLNAALENGISLPYSCRGGVCGICAAICQSGKIEMSVNDVLTSRDLALGWVLTCVGYPATDEVELKIGYEALS